MKSGCKERGFTLLEVLVALSVVAIAMAALIQAAGGNAANQHYLKMRAFSQWVAANRLNEVRLGRVPVSMGRSEGLERMAGREWEWVLDVEETPDRRVLKAVVTVTPVETVSEAGEGSRLVGYLGAPR